MEPSLNDYSYLFEDREDDNFHVNTPINERINKMNHSSIWSLQMINKPMAKENDGLYYNYITSKVEKWEFSVPAPNLSNKIEF